MKLNKLINLINRTGDKIVIEKDDKSYALMSLSDYEKILDNSDQILDLSTLTEDELIGKINKDIAEWKINQEQEIDIPSDFTEETAELSEEEEAEEEEDQYYLEPVD